MIEFTEIKQVFVSGHDSFFNGLVCSQCRQPVFLVLITQVLKKHAKLSQVNLKLRFYSLDGAIEQIHPQRL